jgi:hypothetical protein
VYGNVLNAKQVSMMSETSKWLKDYQAANGTGATALGSVPSATAATPLPATTSASTTASSGTVSTEVTKLADATQWLRQLSGLGVDKERAKRLVLEKLLNPPATDYSLKVPGTQSANLNGETLKSVIQATVQQTLQSVFKTILPKLQQLVYYWSQHPPSTTTTSDTKSDTTTDDNSDSVSDDTT